MLRRLFNRTPSTPFVGAIGIDAERVFWVEYHDPSRSLVDGQVIGVAVIAAARGALALAKARVLEAEPIIGKPKSARVTEITKQQPPVPREFIDRALTEDEAARYLLDVKLRVH